MGLSFYWKNYTIFCHTAIELICIFISFATFLLVWYTYERSPKVNHLIGFGFLMVGIFDLLHVLFFPGVSIYYQRDLSSWYWLMGRLIEAIILIVISRKFKLLINKWTGLLGAVLFAGTSSWLIYHGLTFLPALYVGSSVTPVKIFLEGIIICFFLIALFNVKGQLKKKGVVTFRYIFLALLVAIPGELCFTIFDSITSSLYGMGHLLKIIYYFFFLKAIFVSAVIYSYEKLEENNKLVTTVLNDLPIGVTMYDQNLKLSFANSKALKLFNCELEDIYGYYPEEMEERFSYVSILPKVLKNNKIVKNMLLEATNNSGNRLRLKADYYKLPNRYMVLFEDAKKEEELATLKLQTKTILNSMNNPILITDVENRIIMCNKNSLEVLEMEETEIIGKGIKSLYKIIRGNTTEKLHKIFKMENPGEMHQVVITTVKGNKKELLFHSDLIKNIEKEIIGTIITAADITFINEENKKLRQNEKLIVLGQMAAGVVHEIKNPLTAIKGFSQLIKYKTQEEKVLEYARFIDKETDNINKFVTDFLLFAKPAPPNLQEMTLNNVIEAMKTLIDTNAYIRGIKLDFEFTAIKKLIIVDENQLRQVILNIAKNAMEVVTGLRHPKISISTNYHVQTEEMSVTIFNNGRPMTAEEKKMVGIPFFTTKAKGTGLGLSICFQIIKEHGGRIEIESEEDKGTSFVIYFPCKESSTSENTTVVNL